MVQNAPNGLTGLLSTIQNNLSTLPALLGKYTPGALQKVQGVVNSATNVVNQIDTVVNKAQNLYNMIAPSSPAPTKQAKALGILMAMRDNAVVFTLSTPWGLMAKFDAIKEMRVPRSFVIKHLTFIQDEFQKQISDIAVTVKEVNFASVTSTTSGATQAQATENFAGRAVNNQALSYLGLTNGIPVLSLSLTSTFGKSA